MKTCPYCGEKIQDLAKKCRFCGEWIKEEETKTEKNKSKKVPIIIIIILLILAFVIGGLFFNKKHDIWQGFYFPDGLLDGTEISGPIFDNYDACKDWALSKYDNGYESRCSKNCHDSKGGMGICEDVIRTWHPLPGFGTVFEGIPENRPEPGKGGDILKDGLTSNITSCQEPFNDYMEGSDGYRGYEYAKNGGECNYSNPHSAFDDACIVYKGEYVRYLSCLKGCTLPKNPYSIGSSQWDARQFAFLGHSCDIEDGEFGIRKFASFVVGCNQFYQDEKDFIDCLVSE